MRLVSLLRDGLDMGVNLLLWVNELDAVSEGTVIGFGEDSIGLDPQHGCGLLLLVGWAQERPEPTKKKRSSEDQEPAGLVGKKKSLMGLKLVVGT